MFNRLRLCHSHMDEVAPRGVIGLIQMILTAGSCGTTTISRRVAMVAGQRNPEG